MDWEERAEKALKRIAELEKKVESLERRMNNQYAATDDLVKRVGKLEREGK